MIVVLSSWVPPHPRGENSVKGLKKILNSLLAVWVISTVWGFKSASSCVRRGGPTWRRPGHTSGTGRGGARCVCDSASSVRRSGQISTHSRPSHSGRVSHLGEEKKPGEAIATQCRIGHTGGRASSQLPKHPTLKRASNVFRPPQGHIQFQITNRNIKLKVFLVWVYFFKGNRPTLLYC